MIIEAHAEVQRQPLQRPLILREDSERAVQVHQVHVRRRVDRDGARHAVEHLQVEVAVHVADVLAIAPLQREAGLEGVAAGHVRHRRAVAIDPAVVPEAPLLRRVVVEPCGLLDDRQRRVVDRALWEVLLLKEVSLRRSLEEQLGRDERVPAALHQVVDRAPRLPRRFRRRRGAHVLMAEAAALVDQEQPELVFRVGLIGEPAAGASEP